MNGEFIILNDEKKATHKFVEGGKSWEEVKDFDNIARIVPKPFIVLDFDTKSDSEIMKNIIEGEDLKCSVMETDRGIHVYFRSDEPWKCFKKERLACGIYSDCKSHSKHAYTVIRRNGIDRRWIREIPEDQIETVPAFLKPVKVGNMFSFKDMGDGDGRNQELFNYILTLQDKGMKKDEVIETLRIINEYVFADPLPASELETICRDDAFMSDEKVESKSFFVDGKFSHEAFGRLMMKKHNILFYRGSFHIYEDGYYKKDSDTIKLKRKMTDLFGGITKRQKAEVIDYLAIRCAIYDDEIKIDENVVNLLNCRYDVSTGEITDHDPRYMDFCQMPVKYDPGAKCEAVDQIVEKVFSYDEDLVTLFYEMLGSALMRHNKYQKAFFFVGSGANGKSTLFNMIAEWIGDKNCSRVDISKLGSTSNRFLTMALENKMINIGDDCNNSVLKETGTLKKIFSGDGIMIEHKGSDGYDIKPYATQIFSSNELIKATDYTVGFYRRLIFFPMRAVFTPNSKDYDPMILDKITTDEAKSYILNRAIAGARKLIHDKAYIEPECVSEMLGEYKVENTLSLKFLKERDLDLDKVLITSCQDLYNQFSEWCEENGIRVIPTAVRFHRDIKDHFGFANETSRRRDDNGDRKRYYIMDLDL